MLCTWGIKGSDREKRLGARQGEGHTGGDFHDIVGNVDADLRWKQESETPGRLVKTQIAGSHPQSF